MIEGMRITVTVVRLSVCGSEIVLVSVGLVETVSLRLGFDPNLHLSVDDRKLCYIFLLGPKTRTTINWLPLRCAL